MKDSVDRILEQWHTERPDLDVSPMGLFGRMARLARMQRLASEARYAEYGLNSADFDVLATLRRAGEPYELTPTQLADSMMISITTGGMTGRLARLESRNLISRSQHDRDRRSFRIRLTGEGRQVIDQAVVRHLTAEQELLAPLSATERGTLARLLRKLLAAQG